VTFDVSVWPVSGGLQTHPKMAQWRL